jgi:hypothetical protein
MKVNDKKLIKDLRFMSAPLFSMAADRLDVLSQENAALREKLDLHTKLQPMDTAPTCGKPFILYAEFKYQKHYIPFEFYVCFWDLERQKFNLNDGTLSLSAYNLLGWLPMPEGKDGDDYDWTFFSC